MGHIHLHGMGQNREREELNEHQEIPPPRVTPSLETSHGWPNALTLSGLETLLFGMQIFDTITSVLGLQRAQAWGKPPPSKRSAAWVGDSNLSLSLRVLWGRPCRSAERCPPSPGRAEGEFRGSFCFLARGSNAAAPARRITARFYRRFTIRL